MPEAVAAVFLLEDLAVDQAAAEVVGQDLLRELMETLEHQIPEAALVERGLSDRAQMVVLVL
jgi:hypothetical protein